MQETPYSQEFLVRYRLPRPISRAYETVCQSVNEEEAAHRGLWCLQTALRFVALVKQASRLALDPDLTPQPPSERDLRRQSNEDARRASAGASAGAGARGRGGREASGAARFRDLLDEIDLLPLWRLLEQAGIPASEPALDGTVSLIERAAPDDPALAPAWRTLADRGALCGALECLLPLARLRLAALDGTRLTLLLGPRMEYQVQLATAPGAGPNPDPAPPEGEPLLVDPASGAYLGLAPLALWQKPRASAFGRLFLLRRREGHAGHYLEEGVPGSPGMGGRVTGRPRAGWLPAVASAAIPDASWAPSGAAPAARFADGELLEGHHRVLGLIWRGGTSDVFVAERLADQALVALKTFEYDAALIDENFWRFVKEERFSQQIRHPGVVAAVRLPRGPWGLVHEQHLARRGSLSDLLLSNGVLRVDRALEVCDRLLAVLHAVHAQGVIHNDIKPENILFDEDGTLRLIDFGIAAAAVDESDGLRPGAPPGTPGYIAPEIHDGARPSPRSDLYAAGIVLAEMLGERGVPLRAFLAALAHPDPGARFPSAAAAREALATLRAQVRPERAITLDLEGTLVPGFHRPEPRPGLEAFLAFCLERFDRIFVYTLLAADEAGDLLRQVDARGAMPDGFLQRYEYVEWPRGADGSRKDLRRCGVALEQNLIVDDMAVWIAEDQAHRWVRIRDCATIQGVDRELDRVRAEIERRAAGMA